MVERLRGARAARRHGADVPRPRAEPAAPLLAVAPRRRAAARSCSTRRCRSSCRLARAAARPLPVHAGQGPRRRDRVGEEPPDRRRATYERRGRAASRPAASRRSRSTCSSGIFARLRARQGARRAGSTSTTCWSRPSTCSRTTPTPPTTVRARKRWFSVDEYQDTNPLQQRLLELWLGDRRDLCVVGDEDQTIYTFTGATSELPDRRSPSGTRARGSSTLPRNYRSTPAGPRAREPADRGRAAGRSGWRRRDRDGPEPTIARHADAEARAGRARRPGSASSDRGRHRARRDRGARPDERPARADRGGADAGRRSRTRSAASGSTTGPRSAAAIRASSAAADSTRPGRRSPRRSGAVGRRARASRTDGGDGRRPATRRGSGRRRSRRCSTIVDEPSRVATPADRWRECPRGAGPAAPRASARARPTASTC